MDLMDIPLSLLKLRVFSCAWGSYVSKCLFKSFARFFGLYLLLLLLNYWGSLIFWILIADQICDLQLFCPTMHAISPLPPATRPPPTPGRFSLCSPASNSRFFCMSMHLLLSAFVTQMRNTDNVREEGFALHCGFREISS